MSHPDNYNEFRDHIHDHGDRMRAKVISLAGNHESCGDPKCKYPAFYADLTDEQLEGAAIVLIRFAHEMDSGREKENATRFSEMVFHLTTEQLRRDGEVLNFTCLSEGSTN